MPAGAVIRSRTFSVDLDDDRDLVRRRDRRIERRPALSVHRAVTAAALQSSSSCRRERREEEQQGRHAFVPGWGRSRVAERSKLHHRGDAVLNE